MPKNFAKDLHSLLGKKIDAAEVTLFLKGLDSGEAVRLNSLKEPRWSSAKAGLEIHAAPKTNAIHTLFLKAEGYEKFHQYQGALPHGIDFSMKTAKVKACFPRKPDAESGEHTAWNFNDYRIIVMYKSTGGITTVCLTSDL